MRTTILLTLGALLSLTLFATPALADEAGDAVLAKMDEAMTRATDQIFDYEIVNEEKGRDPKVMAMTATIKGERRLVEFTAPGDMAGMKALALGRGQMYTYLPAYKKVRRVASSMSAGGFMGTTFSNDDISTITYGPSYAGALLSETDEAWVVEATPREGAGSAYGKLVFTIDKGYLQPLEIQYWSTKGKHLKTEVRTGYGCKTAEGADDPKGPICNAESMKMTDHSKGDMSTELVRLRWEVNTDVSDDVFTVRNLEP
jgi:outer membrane lipoprotein-sorting protein